MDLLRTIRAFFERDDIARSLKTLGQCVGGLERIVVVGGALRELTFSEVCSAKPEIPDIDVAVLADFDTSEAVRWLGERTCTRNSFGGVRWQNEWSLPLDVWSARTWAERIGKPTQSEYGIHEVKGFLDFNVNAGTYSPLVVT